MNGLSSYLGLTARLITLTDVQSELTEELAKAKAQVAAKTNKIDGIQNEIDWLNKEYDGLCKLYSESDIDDKLHQLTVAKFDLIGSQYDYERIANGYLTKIAMITNEILDIKTKLLKLDREAYFSD